MHKDEIKGAAKQATGAAKEAIGKVTGNEALRQEGVVDQAVGKTQATYGDVKEDVKDAAKKVVDKI